MERKTNEFVRNLTLITTYWPSRTGLVWTGHQTRLPVQDCATEMWPSARQKL
ncbi:hypothetical protein DPMN_110887 [Dreissena polymorpha]|uniref:Uncharacterized protein n=1 Tax=Dreissena polymorpha TaxID=45954 RepID=A0A9D4QNB3_DREPO|nr:hypothetical protein DPMN_110887 [Dreissena polymorpha]